MDDLLTRDEFKRQVFAKTKGKCCVPGCDCDAVDAHHIMDRKLWADGGYYLSNGAALCSKHNLDAERGAISLTQCLEYMDIDSKLARIPDSLKDEYKNISDYHNAISSGLLDKWGELHEEKASESEYDPDWYKKFNDK